MSLVTKPNHAKVIFLILLGFSVFFGLLIYFGIIAKQNPPITAVKINGMVLPKSQAVADFKLITNKGAYFSNENLKNHWTLLFFGFTNCGDVCPTTLSALNQMYKTLQRELPDRSLPQVVMISVDPDRDTVERLDDYVKAFNPHFLGARTNDNDTTQLEKQLHIAAARMETGQSGKNHYSITHSADILLINPNAKLQAFLTYPHTPEQLVKDYKLIVTNPPT